MLGKTLAHYKVIDHIGTGGMGEVYRAHDTKLDREVALKALPVEFSNDPERVARFEREATTLAKLHHGNVAAIFGFEKDQDRRFLVMELVEGEDLAERLQRGPIPVAEAIGLAAQIAEGLEAAHALGIVHRDLKPANIKITPTGEVKLLDFGLARAYADDGSSSTAMEVSNSPTITAAMTMAGTILGTAAYMSPEQARGKSIDRQSDIWAFGVVLHEMLTAQRLFGGETVSDSIGAILHRNPELDLLPPVPPQILTLLSRCLARDKKERLRDIGDARLELADAMANAVTRKKESGPRIGRGAWAVAVAVLLLAAVLGWTALTDDAEPKLSRVTLGTPRNQAILFTDVAWPLMRFAPDGQKVVYIGGNGRDFKLFLRDIDAFEATPLSGTDQAELCDFSPDGRWVVYMADSKIFKIALSGGAPVELCETVAGPGLAWGLDEIYFTKGNGGGLWSVPVAGGEPRQVTTLDDGREETSHRWPHVLPGGRHLLFTIKTARITTFDDALIGLLDLDTGEIQVIIRGGSQPHYADTGHILYGRNSQLLAVPFDLESLTVQGTPSLVLDQVTNMSFNGATQFSLSKSGNLAYFPVDGSLADYEVLWLNRSGRISRLDIAQTNYFDMDLASDGQRIAGMVSAANDKINIFDLERQTMTRLTNTPGNDGNPKWSPDGSLVAYSNDRDGYNDLYVIPADGSAPARRLLASEFNDRATCWTPDGNHLLFTRIDVGGKPTSWIIPIDGNSEPEPLFKAGMTSDRTQVSPDGRWLAYCSDFSGEWNVYVRPFRRQGGAVRVSINEANWPQWAPDGQTIYFRTDGAMMAAPLETGPTLRVGVPQPIFEVGEDLFGKSDLSPDGERFIFNSTRRSMYHHLGFRVVFDWAESLKKVRP